MPLPSDVPGRLKDERKVNMDSWLNALGSCISTWRVNRSVRQSSRRIAQEIFSELRENVQRKAGLQNNRAFVASYARSRATHLCYSRVDTLVAVDRNISGAVAAKIISQSANRAVEMVLLEIRNFRCICE